MTEHFWRSTNSPNVIWVDTRMHRCTEMEADFRYPIDAELGQGRHAKNRIPRISMYAGIPSTEDVDAHNERARALRRMLAAAVGAWLAFGVLVWVAYSRTQGA